MKASKSLARPEALGGLGYVFTSSVVVKFSEVVIAIAVSVHLDVLMFLRGLRFFSALLRFAVPVFLVFFLIVFFDVWCN